MRNLLVLFLVIAGLVVEAKDNKQQWKEYTFDDDGFVISLPAPVTPHKDAKDPEFNVYSVSFGTNSLLNLRASSQPTDCDVFISQLRQRLQDTKPTDKYAPLSGSFKQIVIEGRPALQYEYSFSDTQTRLERYYCAYQKLYIFSVVYPVNQPRPSDSDRILNSFELIRDDSKRQARRQVKHQLRR